MSSFELNKVFAAILCASITVMLSGFIAKKLVVDKKLKEDAVAIEGAAIAGGHSGPAKPKLPDPIMALLAQADLEKGAKVSKVCAACHSFDKGGPTKQGPNLWNIVNGPKAGVAAFSYSDGLMAMAGEKWTYDSLNKFLAKPKKYISDTKMNFAGLRKPKDRAALIAWLRTQADSPAALPTEAEIAAEQAAFAPPEEELSPTEASVENGQH